MKIGEFAKICGTKITVLRHYDKEKLLVPEYTDEFSGYRHYSSEQILSFHRISALKKAGFSLQEIRELISCEKTAEEIAHIFGRKEAYYLEAIEFLKEARLMMTRLDIKFSGDTAVIRRGADDNALDLCTVAEAEIKAADYQRISRYEIKDNEIICRVVKLGDEVRQQKRELPFVNDEAAVGRWEIKGVYAVKEDLRDNILCDSTGFYGGEVKYLYFLENGEEYWGNSWTRGYFICNSYLTGTTYNEYELEDKSDGTYMIITLRETQVCRGGEPEYLLLKKADGNKYHAEDIARKDDIDKPFVTDERAVGKWISHSFLGAHWDESDFPAEREALEDLYFRELYFFPDGNAKCVYEDAVFEGEDTVTWTKNYLLRRWNRSACEYEIRTVDGIDYLIIEWKSGDYRYGGYDTNYYVFVRE